MHSVRASESKQLYLSVSDHRPADASHLDRVVAFFDDPKDAELFIKANIKRKVDQDRYGWPDAQAMEEVVKRREEAMQKVMEEVVKRREEAMQKVMDAFMNGSQRFLTSVPKEFGGGNQVTTMRDSRWQQVRAAHVPLEQQPMTDPGDATVGGCWSAPPIVHDGQPTKSSVADEINAICAGLGVPHRVLVGDVQDRAVEPTSSTDGQPDPVAEFFKAGGG